MLLHKENNDLEQIALDQAKNDNSNDIKQDEVQLTEKDNVTTITIVTLSFLFAKRKSQMLSLI